MNKLEVPNLDKTTLEIYDECLNNYREKDKKIRLKKLKPKMENAIKEYKECVPHKIEKYSSPEVEEDENKLLLKVYSDKFSKKNTVGRKYYDKIMNNAGGICPICGCSAPTQLDHYLPKSKYPLLVVESSNLVPICMACNYNKRTYMGEKFSEMLIHPYFEEINIKWLGLEIEFKQKEITDIVFNNILSEVMNPILKRRLDLFVKIYKPYESYKALVVQELGSIKYIHNMMLAESGADSLLRHLEDQMYSIEQNDINSWKAALYRALIVQLLFVILYTPHTPNFKQIKRRYSIN